MLNNCIFCCREWLSSRPRGREERRCSSRGSISGPKGDALPAQAALMLPGQFSGRAISKEIERFVIHNNIDISVLLYSACRRCRHLPRQYNRDSRKRIQGPLDTSPPPIINPPSSNSRHATSPRRMLSDHLSCSAMPAVSNPPATASGGSNESHVFEHHHEDLVVLLLCQHGPTLLHLCSTMPSSITTADDWPLARVTARFVYGNSTELATRAS